MRKKKRKIAADEGFEFGPIRMMRFGKMNVIQNRMNPEQHNAFMSRLADQHPKVCQEIDQLVLRIMTAVARFSPLHLLHRAYWEYLPSAIGVVSEVEIGQEAIEKRFIVEYLQSMICSVTPQEVQKESPSDEEWSLLTTDICSLLNKLVSEYFLTRSAWAKRNDPNFDEKQEEYSVQAQMHWVAVRGDRYLSHDLPHFHDLLLPHDDELTKLFGISSRNILIGLEQIIRNFTSGPKDAFDELKIFQEQTLDALEKYIEETGETGSPADLMNKVIEQKAWQDWRDKVMGNALGYGLFNMGAATGWPHELLECLSWKPGEDSEFLAEGIFRGWPLRVLPIWKRPFLKIDEHYYSFGIYSLTDHGYRIFQRVILNRDPDYRETWNVRQKEVSENLPFNLLCRLLPNATTYHSVYYQLATGGNNKKQWCETDGLLIYDDHLIVIEVKAGAFTYTPPSTDFPAYIHSLEALLRSPSEQTARFCNYLQSAPQVTIYDSEHREIAVLAHGNFRHVTRCCITLDQLTEFAARAESLHEIGINVGNTPVWTISVDDLRVFADVIENPLVFCHFLEERARAFLSPALQTNDELDHLALYLAHNRYANYAEDFDFDRPVSWHGYREDLDRFFSSKVGGEPAEQPGQPMPSRLKEIIHLLADTNISSRCKAAAWLLDMGGEFRDQSNELINQILEEQERVGRPKPVTCIGDIPITFYCSIDNVIKHSNHLIRIHTLATLQLSNETERLALKLDYSSNKKLQAVTPIFFSAKDINANETEELSNYAQRMVERRFNARLTKGVKRKIGRNELCPCGSGKKYKKCCRLSGSIIKSHL